MEIEITVLYFVGDLTLKSEPDYEVTYLCHLLVVVINHLTY